MNKLMMKTWDRCKSFGRGEKMSSSSSRRGLSRKIKSWPSMDEKGGGRKGQIVPEGCLSVYVGREKERFVIKTECVNHPLFKKLLEEAEYEYGYTSKGPLQLPCKVEVFYQVLMAMEDDCDHHAHTPRSSSTSRYSFLAR